MRTRSPLIVAATVVVFVGLFFACGGVKTDIGKSCVLIKSLPDGGSANVVPEDLLDNSGQLPSGTDVISYGTPDCDQQVCIVDSSNLPAAVDAGAQNPANGIQGYCSTPCSKQSDCAVQFNDQQKDANLAMTCRPLVLDQDAINQICAADPAKCAGYFGPNQGSLFCARGSADGGT